MSAIEPLCFKEPVVRYAVIMAGGAGTRMWPASRVNRPKQLLRLFGGKSLLRESYERIARVVPPESICVITGSVHLAQVAEQLPELSVENLFGEPCGRDTANAVGLAAAILHERDPDATVGVFTADHIITPPERFEQALQAGYEAAEVHADALVTFGIRPETAHTGYGYVRRGRKLGGSVYEVERFTEKPDQATAIRYLQDGRHYWNSGMFTWRTATILDQLKQHLPDSFDGVREIARAWDSPGKASVLERVYPDLEKISIDYAVMERAPRVLLVEMDCHWVDVGSWTALENVITPDEHGNVQAAPSVLHVDSKRTVAVSEDDHLIATLGVDDLVVVHTRDATFIGRKDRAEQLKELVAALRRRFGDRFL
ncbi:MAG: mannose-1-phosphate guanylyltransferase [Phycisphaerales bacterium]|nr:MAG: mannose-1-phosphate guanylyltransferase [Phycisphaerales bacterium]